MHRHILPTAALKRVTLWSLALAAYSGVAFWKEQSPFANYADFPAGLEAVISLAIGLLLAFRINRAFDRWWEARTLWGALVNASRNLAVKAHNALGENDQSTARLERLIIAFPLALRDHLRRGAELQRLPGFENEPPGARHVPAWMVNQIYALLEGWKDQGRIDQASFWALDREALRLLDICGGCERIRNTPIAPSFRVMLNQALAIYLLTLPWGVVNEFGVWTIPVVFLSSYFIVGGEVLADHIEQPFEPDGDCLDLDRLCQVIEASVSEVFATETARPAAD